MQGCFMTDPVTSERRGPGIAANYIIALNGKNEGTFIICHPTLIISEGENWGGLTAQQIAAYITRHALSAAPLPGRPLTPVEFMAGPGH